MEKLSRRLCRLLKCDAARISRPSGPTMFLIIGTKRNTREDKSAVWVDQDGREVHFEYLEESCVASGDTVEALVNSARFYRSLKGHTFYDLLFKKTKVVHHIREKFGLAGF